MFTHNVRFLSRELLILNHPLRTSNIIYIRGAETVTISTVVISSPFCLVFSSFVYYVGALSSIFRGSV